MTCFQALGETRSHHYGLSIEELTAYSEGQQIKPRIDLQQQYTTYLNKFRTMNPAPALLYLRKQLAMVDGHLRTYIVAGQKNFTSQQALGFLTAVTFYLAAWKAFKDSFGFDVYVTSADKKSWDQIQKLRARIEQNAEVISRWSPGKGDAYHLKVLHGIKAKPMPSPAPSDPGATAPTSTPAPSGPGIPAYTPESEKSFFQKNAGNIALAASAALAFFALNK